MEIPFYKIGKQSTDSIIKLNANEGIDFFNKKLNFYPKPQPEKCLDFFYNFYGVDKHNIMMTQGIDGGLMQFLNLLNLKI